MFRKLLLCAPLALCLGLAFTPAYATGNHHEQSDGCDHGNTGKDCKPDPQPDHGKDCDEHGNHGGVNEDHCLPTSTTTTMTVPPTTTTTFPNVLTTTTTGAGSNYVLPTTTTTTGTIITESPTLTTPSSLGCMTPDGFPYVTNIEQGGCLHPGGPTPTSAPSTVTATTELAKTGDDAGLLFVIGTAVLLAGLSCWFCGKAID